MHGERGDADGRREADLCRANHTPGRQHDFAGRDVGPGGPHVGPRAGGGLEDAHAAGAVGGRRQLLRVFNLHDGVRAVWQGGAG